MRQTAKEYNAQKLIKLSTLMFPNIDSRFYSSNMVRSWRTCWTIQTPSLYFFRN